MQLTIWMIPLFVILALFGLLMVLARNFPPTDENRLRKRLRKIKRKGSVR